MERKNIFRGKNKKNGWIYGDLIHNRGEVFIAPLGIANPFATAEDFVVDEDSVGYFTGLKDKTNKDIYEGDIIIIDRMANEYNLISNVEYISGSFKVKYMWPLRKYSDKCRVIGNIYDTHN